MAIKANASSQGAAPEFKHYVGVGSFNVLGVNPTREELSKFYGNEVKKDPSYLTDKEDKEGKPYKSLRVQFMLQANLEYVDGEPNKTNAALTEPFKTTISFFLENRYEFNNEKTKVKVIDKYRRTAWVPIEQAKNHQIPVYSNGPARIDKDYRPLLRGEEQLTDFLLNNYLCLTPIERYNKNTGEYIPASCAPKDCEGRLDKLQNYFKGDISELKEYAALIPSNTVKVLIGVNTDDEGNQHDNAYTNVTLKNSVYSYISLKDDIEKNRKWSNSLRNTVFSNDPIGIISDICEYKSNVKETDLSKPVEDKDFDPFKEAAKLPEDDNTGLPFDGPAPASNDDDPFGLGVA